MQLKSSVRGTWYCALGPCAIMSGTGRRGLQCLCKGWSSLGPINHLSSPSPTHRAMEQNSYISKAHSTNRDEIWIFKPPALLLSTAEHAAAQLQSRGVMRKEAQPGGTELGAGACLGWMDLCVLLNWAAMDTEHLQLCKINLNIWLFSGSKVPSYYST